MIKISLIFLILPFKGDREGPPKASVGPIWGRGADMGPWGRYGADMGPWGRYGAEGPMLGQVLGGKMDFLKKVQRPK